MKKGFLLSEPDFCSAECFKKRPQNKKRYASEDSEMQRPKGISSHRKKRPNRKTEAGWN